MESQQDAYRNVTNGNGDLPCVSVIVPVYNVAPYLREALDSVVGQSYRNLEIIIVDDGSTDGSSEICDEYLSDPRVQVIHQENRGLSNARNAGLDLFSGVYIAFLDSDDAFHPKFVQSMVDEIGDADAAVCRYEVHQGTLASWGQIFPRMKEDVYSRKEALLALVNGKINVSVWNKLYRRGLWREIRFPDGHNYEDIHTTYRIFDCCERVKVLDQVLYLHRRRPGSITQVWTKKNIEDRKLAHDDLLAFVKTHTPEVFDEMDVRRIKGSWLRVMLVSYARGQMELADVKAACERVKAGELGFRAMVGYRIIQLCPGLLKILYPVYRPFRELARKILGR